MMPPGTACIKNDFAAVFCEQEGEGEALVPFDGDERGVPALRRGGKVTRLIDFRSGPANSAEHGCC
jgi:hypothetical protein